MMEVASRHLVKKLQIQLIKARRLGINIEKEADMKKPPQWVACLGSCVSSLAGGIRTERVCLPMAGGQASLRKVARLTLVSLPKVAGQDLRA